jgi:hypothetical protein
MYFTACTSELTTEDVRSHSHRILGNGKKCRNVLILVKLFNSSCHEETLSIAPKGTLMPGVCQISNRLEKWGHQTDVQLIVGVTTAV